MKKKNIIVLSSIFLVVVVGLFIYGAAIKTPVQEGQPVESKPATFPSETTNQQNIQTINKKIDNISESPASQQAVKDGIGSIDFKKENNNIIPLADFEKATNTKIIKQLRDYLDSNDYNMYYCPTAGSRTDYAMYFGYNIGKVYGNLYPDTLTWMKGWEKSMLRDLHGALFPGVEFSGTELNRNLQFKLGKFRYAEIRLPDGKAGSINYRVSDNGVIVSSSQPCLEKMIEIYEPYQE
jgi:hypothetical protein